MTGLFQDAQIPVDNDPKSIHGHEQQTHKVRTHLLPKKAGCCFRVHPNAVASQVPLTRIFHAQTHETFSCQT